MSLTQTTQASRSWQKEMFPNPDQCGRGDVSMICDPDAVLTETEKNSIEGWLNLIYESRGLQVSVALMEKMNTGDSAEVFARYLHDTWGVGDKERDTGILLLLAVENRQTFISTGKGAREAVPDTAVQTIIKEFQVWNSGAAKRTVSARVFLC